MMKPITRPEPSVSGKEGPKFRAKRDNAVVIEPHNPGPQKKPVSAALASLNLYYEIEKI
jgi:hypothetical protein